MVRPAAWACCFSTARCFRPSPCWKTLPLPCANCGTLPQSLIDDVAMVKLQMVGLDPSHAHKMPADLSGGMVKRVALARALVMDPPLLLLDEPTAGLDPDSSDAFCQLLRSLHRELGLTVVMVTHDLDTLFELSTRIAVVADKHIVVCDAPLTVMRHPHPFIHDFFLGERGPARQRAVAPDPCQRVERASYGKQIPRPRRRHLCGAVAGLLVIAWSVWLTRDTRDLQIYELSSPDAVTGLQPQASVRFKGVNVGQGHGHHPGPQDTRQRADPALPLTARRPSPSPALPPWAFKASPAWRLCNWMTPASPRSAPGGTPPARIPMRRNFMTKLSAQGENLALLVDVGERVNQLLSPENQKSFIGAVNNLDKAAVGIGKLAVDTGKVLPELMQEAKETLSTLKATSIDVSESAEEARKSAAAFRK